MGKSNLHQQGVSPQSRMVGERGKSQKSKVKSQKLLLKLFVLAFIVHCSLLTVHCYSQGVGINTTGNPADNSAMLDVSSTNLGILIPRMTTAQMNAISSPATGLIIYNTDCNNLNYNAGTAGSPNWVTINSTNAVGIPSNITGSASVCANQTGITYSIAAVGGATSYNWTVPSGATITAGALTNSITVTFGSASGNISITASNACGMSSASTLAVTIAWSCGCPLTVTHTAGSVAPKTETVTYGTVSTTLTGATECWITQNLGAIQQATSDSAATDASAGWYWEWNLKQGYSWNSTSSSLTPTPFPDSYGTDTSWISTQEPCNLLLGTGWRLPTLTEWENIHKDGFTSATIYSSVLKIPAGGGYLNSSGLLTDRGIEGAYWSSTFYYAPNAWNLGTNATYPADIQDVIGTTDDFAYWGLSVRCLNP